VLTVEAAQLLASNAVQGYLVHEHHDYAVAAEFRH
jgi:hypothetical protein